MSLIDVQHVSKSFGGDLVFSDVSFRVLKGQKVAIVGPNGAGKSTLLKIILGEEVADEGHVHKASQLHIGYLSQTAISSLHNTVEEEMNTVYAHLQRLQVELQRLSHAMVDHPDDHALLKRYGELEHQFEEQEGYTYHHRIHEVLSGFGFSTTELGREIASFSGGERTKIAFAKLLLTQPELLILDEPTNHLDIDTITWLENYLANYGAAILFVSHDRYFIDMIATHIVEMDYHVAEWYVGNYTTYLDEKSLRFEQRLLHFKMQQKEMEHLRVLIEKFKPKPNKVRFAKDREKKLARLQAQAVDDPRRSQATIKLKLQHEGFQHRAQFSLNDFTVGYDYPFFQPLTKTVYSGDKIAIMGANGSGKTTLMKAIQGLIEPWQGTRTDHRSLVVGFFDQHQIDLSGDQSMMDYLHDLYPHLTHLDVRKQLGAFLFSQDDVFKPLSVLSGGEKMRLAFAVLFMKHYDILLLDEPTNHLDLTTKKVLENALDDYPGTVIMISHDRYFVDEVVNEVWYIQNRQLTLHEGNYSSYQLSLQPISDEPYIKAKSKPTNNEPVLPKTKPIDLPSLSVLEKRINDLTAQRNDLQSVLQDEDIALDYVELRELEDQLNLIEIDLHDSEQQYLLRLEYDETKGAN